MLLIYPDIMAHSVCDTLIHEHATNPNKRITLEADQSFDDRVLLLQNMTQEAGFLAASIAHEMGEVIGRHFQVPVYPETVAVVRWDAGQEMALHQDGQRPETANRTHSVVVYLNDQADGGEIYFPDIGTTISPRRALMVAYEKAMLHGVRPVMHPRYTLTLWYSTDPAVSIIAFG
jgi:prolyl 4-hydroxylase